MTILVEQYTNRQPNSAYCFVCGRDNPRGLYMAFFDNGRNEVLSRYSVPNVYQGYPGVVHGGVVAAMLDEVVARVAMIDDPHRFMMSVTLQVKFRHVVPTETPLRVLGRVVRLRGRLGKAVGQIILPNNTVAAESEMTLADVPVDFLGKVNLEVLGWRVDGDVKSKM